MKFISAILLLLTYCSAYAGFDGLTHHSRANCINNESISWDATRSWDLTVESDHSYKSSWDQAHSVVTPFVNTWRSAAVHWGEGIKTGTDWSVYGYHFTSNSDGYSELIAVTTATDCNIYDGWWEKDPPPQGYQN